MHPQHLLPALTFASLLSVAVFFAFFRGRVAEVKVDGADSRAIYPGRDGEAVSPGAQVDAGLESAGDEAELQAMFSVVARAKPALAGLGKDLQEEQGKQVYLNLCHACHQPDGKGLSGAFPPLAGSDYMLADRERAIRTVLKGLTGPITVNGVTINSVMPPQETVLTDAQIADVLTFVFNAWGNRGEPFKADQVKAVRSGKY